MSRGGFSSNWVRFEGNQHIGRPLEGGIRRDRIDVQLLDGQEVATVILFMVFLTVTMWEVAI